MLPDLTVGYPEGMAGLDLDESSLRRYLGRRLTILLGAADTDVTAADLPRMEAAMAQGPHRLARGQWYVRHCETSPRGAARPSAGRWMCCREPDTSVRASTIMRPASLRTEAVAAAPSLLRTPLRGDEGATVWRRSISVQCSCRRKSLLFHCSAGVLSCFTRVPRIAAGSAGMRKPQSRLTWRHCSGWSTKPPTAPRVSIPGRSTSSVTRRKRPRRSSRTRSALKDEEELERCRNRTVPIRKICAGCGPVACGRDREACRQSEAGLRQAAIRRGHGGVRKADGFEAPEIRHSRDRLKFPTLGR